MFLKGAISSGIKIKIPDSNSLHKKSWEFDEKFLQNSLISTKETAWDLGWVLIGTNSWVRTAEVSPSTTKRPEGVVRPKRLGWDPFFKPKLEVKQTGEKCLEQSLEQEVI